MIEKQILIITNSEKYQEASGYLMQMAKILLEMDYQPVTLEEESDFAEKLAAYAVQAERTIECKAVFSCNGIGMDKIPQMLDCLHVVYLDEKGASETAFLSLENQGTVLISTLPLTAEAWKEDYPNLGEVFCIENCADNLEQQLLEQTRIIFDIQELIAIR